VPSAGTAGLAERLAAETYRYELASAGIRIWDLTNNSTLTQDAKGKLTGTYSDSFWIWTPTAIALMQWLPAHSRDR